MRARILAMQATHGNQFVQQQLSGERPTSRPARPREAPASPTIARMFASTQMMGLDLAFPDVHLLPTGAWVPVPHPGIGAGPTSVTGVRTGAFTTMPDIPMPAIIGLAGPRVIASTWSGQIVGQLLAAASAMHTVPVASYAMAKGVGGALPGLTERARASMPDQVMDQMTISGEKIRTATTMVEPFAGVTRTGEEVEAELHGAAADAVATGAAIQAEAATGSGVPADPMGVPAGNPAAQAIASLWSGLIVGQLHAAASAMRTSPTVAYTLAMGVGGALSRLMGRSRGSLPERLVNQMAITSEKIRTATVMVEPFAGVTRTQDEVAAELLSAAADAIATGAAIDAVEAKAAAAAAAAAAEPPGRFVVGRGPGRVVPSQVRVFLLAPRRVDED